jgi:tRNA G46 methylase TrmB
VVYKNRDLVVEIGAGSALFLVELARQNPTKIFVATDIKSDRMYRGARRADELKLENIFFVRCDIARIAQAFSPRCVSEIWLTFPDPFAKENYQSVRADFAKFYHDFLRFSGDENYAKNRAKYDKDLQEFTKKTRENFADFLSANSRKRLTDAKFLQKYAQILTRDGRLNFKTDNAPLFEWSLKSFLENGWKTEFLTRDLHGDLDVPDDAKTILKDSPSHSRKISNKIPDFLLNARIMTSYEEKFAKEGLKINYARCSSSPENWRL